MRKQRAASEAGFDRYDKSRLRKAIEQVADKRTYLRLQAVLFVAEGRPIDEVSHIVNRGVSTIYYWINLYLKNHCTRDLFDRPKKGRPRVAKQITDTRILKELDRNPISLGYMVTTWTVATLANHLSHRYKCPITSYTLYRRMKEMGLECKRPKYFYEQKDPNRAQKKGLSSES